MKIKYHRHSVATLLSTKRPAQVYRDEEFGDIPYHRVPHSQHVRIRMSTDGSLRASLPLFAPLSSLKKLIDSSRAELQKISVSKKVDKYYNGQHIGHSHTLSLIPNRSNVLRGSVSHQKVVVSYPESDDPSSQAVQSTIRTYISQALRKESKAYLPRRLEYLAEQEGFSYKKVRFAHQSGRWGSCSARGTISLNIALMMLPFELIDYVLLHELSHTIHMNHSPAFWRLVESYYPDYKNARKLLKTHNPYL